MENEIYPLLPLMVYRVYPDIWMGLGGVAGWIGDVGLFKTISPQPAGVAASAGTPLIIGLVAGDSQTVIEAQFDAPADDLTLGEVDEWGVDLEGVPFDTGLGGDVGQLLE